MDYATCYEEIADHDIEEAIRLVSNSRLAMRHGNFNLAMQYLGDARKLAEVAKTYYKWADEAYEAGV